MLVVVSHSSLGQPVDIVLPLFSLPETLGQNYCAPPPLIPEARNRDALYASLS